MSKKTKTYNVQMTEKQMQATSVALEVFARLGIGQFRDALDRLPLKDGVRHGWHDDMDEIGSLLSKYMVGNIDGGRSSLGISDPRTDESAKVAWDLHQVLRRRLSWEKAVEEGIVPDIDSPRKWPEMFGVYYDDPMKTSREPLATVGTATEKG